MKILLHNLSSPLFNYHPDTYDFDQGGFFFASPGDAVITRKDFSASEHTQYLKEIGVIKENITHYYSLKIFTKHDEIFHDERIKKLVREHVAAKNDIILDTYVNTRLEESWSNDVGLHISCPASICYEFNSKLKFKSIVSQLGLSVVSGSLKKFESFSSIWANSVQNRLLNGTKTFVTKYDRGGRGIGSITYKSHSLFSPNGLRSLYSRLKDENDHLHIQIPRERLVEEWMLNVKYSPSLQYEITPEGKIILHSIHLQTLSPISHSYTGCKSHHWLPKVLCGQLTQQSNLIAKKLKDMGYRGFIGLDTIIDSKGQIFWTEANVRKTMPMYAKQISKRVSPQLDAPYLSVFVSVPKLRGLNHKDLLIKLEPLLYTTKNKSGVIPYDLSLLKAFGFFNALVIGADIHDVENLNRNLQILSST